MFHKRYNGLRVLITGHTGFKGSWLALWLLRLGARVAGLSLEPPTLPNHFDLLHLDMETVLADIRDRARVLEAVRRFRPEIIFHMAAQSLVLRSYADPVETFETNLMGVVNVLEACRHVDTVRAVVNVTSDKCYANQEWVWGYRENDPLGGHDPYSASKACAELAAESYQRAFFSVDARSGTSRTLMASVRAGNILGGGDWAQDRLIPDIMRAASQGESVHVRSPHATRPWQHVLDPLAGYLLVGQRLLDGHREFAQAWNFGPAAADSISVIDVAQNLKSFWPSVRLRLPENDGQPHEAHNLRLDCSKALVQLGWRTIWGPPILFEKTVSWYRAFYEERQVLSEQQLSDYLADAQRERLPWVTD